MTPNRLETSRATDRCIETPNDAGLAGAWLCESLGLDFATITLDSDGVAIVLADGTAKHFATRRREVYDITGAGDMVLAIIGLLIGGVLKGHEMITNAKLKRIEIDQADVMTAMFSYQDRYLQLPGDDSGANDRFTVYGGNVVVNGNSSGTIDGAWDELATLDVDDSLRRLASKAGAALAARSSPKGL